MINDRLLPNVSRFEAINEPIWFIRLRISDQNIIIINCHAPTEDKDGEAKDAFYEELERTYDSLPRRAIKIIMGDMNAKIGRENVFRPTIGKESPHIVSNDNGTRFINFAMSRDIIISSTYFQRKDSYKQTWVSPDATTKNQIDHVTIDKLHCSWFKNVRCYRGADGDTDHYLVVATLTEKLSASWKKNKSRNKTNTIDLNRLKDPVKIRQYRTRIAEEFRNINERVEIKADNHETKWTNIKKVINTTTENFKTEPRSNKKNGWFNNECMEAVKKRNEARLNMIHISSIENQAKYKHYKEIVNKTIRRGKRLAEKKTLEKLKEERNNPRKFFKHCKCFKQDFKQQTLFLKTTRMIFSRNQEK